MMDVAIAQTEGLRVYENPKIEYILFKRYLIRYMIGKDKDDIIKAKKIIVKLNREYEKNAHLQLMLCLAYTVNSELIEAENIFNDVNMYRSYYKKNEKDVYRLLLFVEIIIIKDTEKKTDEKIAELTSIKDSKSYMYLACAYLTMGKWKKCYEQMNLAFIHGCSSPFLYYCLYEYFRLRVIVEDNDKLLFRLVSWCIKNEIPYKFLIKNQYKQILEQIPENIDVAIDMYRQIESNVLLADIVNCLIVSNAKMCPEYFELYVIANNKQLKIDGLNNALVKGASIYGYEDVSNYTMRNFLATKMSNSEKRYVYHMLVTNDKLQNLIPGYENDIYTTCISSIGEKNIHRYTLSLYKYVLDNLDRYTVAELYIGQIEDVVYDNLFLHEIIVEDENATHVMIKQKLVSKVYKYELVNKKAMISIVDDEYIVIVVDDSCNCIIESEYSITARVTGDKTNLCNYFCKKDRINNDILLNIAMHYIKDGEEFYQPSVVGSMDKFIELLDDDYVSQEANNKLSMYIGNCYSCVQDYRNAIKFYEQVKYDNKIKISDKVITSYINMKDYDKLLDIVVNNYKDIDIDVLTKAVKILLDNSNNSSELSQVSYYLIQNNVEDDKIYDNFGLYYEGEIRDYKEVYDKINDKTNINKNIVNRTIMGRKLGTSRKNVVVFLEMVIETYMNSNEGNIEELSYYLAYEMLINDYVPSTEIIKLLEEREILLENEEVIIALAKLYVNNGIKTKNSTKILQKAINVCKNRHIMFPFIKWQNEITDIEYVKKYTPFVYYGDKDDTVSMQYKKDGEFFVIDMDYYKFGIHITILNLFYNEEVEYQYIVRKKNGDLVKTESQHIINTNMSIVDVKDSFFLTNNALIYKDMHKYDEVIKIINNMEENIEDYKLL